MRGGLHLWGGRASRLPGEAGAGQWCLLASAHQTRERAQEDPLLHSDPDLPAL